MTKKVLITRSEENSARLLGLLRKDGIDAFAVPVTKVVYAVSAKKLPDLVEYNWLVFTSANGVLAFHELFRKTDKSLPTDLKIAAIGTHTAARVERCFRKPDLIPGKANGLSLAREILETANDGSELSVLWPCAENALPDFPERLIGAGSRIHRWACYRIEPIDRESLAGELESRAPWDIALFAAPSAVRAFADAWTRKDGFTALALGQTTMKELKESGFPDIAVSRGVSVSDCARTINEIFNKRIVR